MAEQAGSRISRKRKKPPGPAASRDGARTEGCRPPGGNKFGKSVLHCHGQQAGGLDRRSRSSLLRNCAAMKAAASVKALEEDLEALTSRLARWAI